MKRNRITWLDVWLTWFITYACFSMSLAELEDHPIKKRHHKKERPGFEVFCQNLFWNTLTVLPVAYVHEQAIR